MKRFASA